MQLAVGPCDRDRRHHSTIGVPVRVSPGRVTGTGPSQREVRPMPMKIPEPTKAEAVALFRLGIVGDLLARELSPGELRAELIARSAERYRPPGASASRQFH